MRRLGGAVADGQMVRVIPQNRHTTDSDDARRFDAPPIVTATTFSARHTMHKYWGKKPGNVVAAYIRNYAEPDATVLDMFAGSGVVLTESLIERRPGIAVDLNPVASLIARVTVEGAVPDAVEAQGRELLEVIRPLRNALFAELCSQCGALGEIVSTGYKGDTPVRIKLDCPSCGSVMQLPRKKDFRLRSVKPHLPDTGSFPDGEIYQGWQMQKLVRRGVRRWSELFTPRNLVAVAHLRRAIQQVQDDRIRRALMVSFTAHLAQSTRMIADFAGKAGGPSWKLNCYWLPLVWQDLNPFRYFENRVRKTVRGLRNMQAQLGRTVEEGSDFNIWTMSAARLNERLSRASVGYIFTDPPYGGEGIQYGELSMLWNLWCDQPMALEQEVNFNPYQEKDENFYASQLKDCMAAGFEVLAPNCWMSVTFANKDLRVWRSLIDVCRHVGFDLCSVVPMSPSAPNLTNMLAKAAPKSDLILNFRKPIRLRQRTPVEHSFDLSTWVQEEAARLIAAVGSFRTSDIFDRLVIRWMTWHYTAKQPSTSPRFTARDVEELLAKVPLKPERVKTKRDVDLKWMPVDSIAMYVPPR